MTWKYSHSEPRSFGTGTLDSSGETLPKLCHSNSTAPVLMSTSWMMLSTILAFFGPPQAARLRSKRS